MAGKKFNSRRAPAGQVKARVDSTCRAILARSAGGNIRNVTMTMVQNAAGKNGIPVEQIAQKLRGMGAPI